MQKIRSQVRIEHRRFAAADLLVTHGVSCVLAIGACHGAGAGVRRLSVQVRRPRRTTDFFAHGARRTWSGPLIAFSGRTLRRRLSDVAIAQRVERQFPQLGDRLSTSVEFLKQQEDDAFAGSAALRRAVVTTTTADVESLDFRAAIERKPTHKALRIAGLLGRVRASCLPVAIPSAARVAIARLVRPFGNDAWPRQTNLQIVGTPPTRLAVGQTFELNVVDRNGTLARRGANSSCATIRPKATAGATNASSRCSGSTTRSSRDKKT